MTIEATKHVVVLGAGFIGTSMAAVFVDNGWWVTLADLDPERIHAAHDSVAVRDSAMASAGL